jgi:uncharacterized membrane protein YhaH (DUF805 family)
MRDRSEGARAAPFAYDHAMHTVRVNTGAPSAFDDPIPLSQVLFSFRGRVPRKLFWLYGVLGPLLVSVMLEMLLGIVGIGDRRAEAVSSLILVWPCAAVAVKRWHDRNKSGWWVLITFIPLVGMLWALVENGLLRGTVGPNRFGADLTGRV